MKKVLLSILSLPILANIAYSQINVQWETRFTAAGNNPDNVSDMYVDASGNIYVTGSSYTAASGYDIVTRKYDNNGGVTWTSTFNGSGNGTDVAAALAVDGSGNVFVTGYSYIGGTDFNITTIKYTSAGAQSWQNYSGNGTSSFDEGRDIAIDANNDVIVVGGVQNAAGTNTDYRTIKYTNAGGTTFTVDYSNSTNLDMALAVVTDASNNIYVTGHSFVTGQDMNIRTIKYNSAGTQQYNTATNFSIINSIDSPSKIVVNGSGEVFVAGRVFNGSTTDDDIVVMKYNAAGTVVNNTIINGTADNVDKANRIFLDASNNLYLAGRVKNTGTSEDFYLAKFNSSLGLIWDDSYNGPNSNYDEATDITIDASSNVYVCGSSFSTASNYDFLTVKYDGATGTRTWLTKFNGPGNNTDQAKRINVDAAGNVYVSGDSKGLGTGLDYSTIKYCQLTTDAGLDTSICINQTVQLLVTGGPSITWQASPSLSCTTCPNPIANPTSDATYIVSTTSGSGCTDYDTVQVIINPLPGPVITTSGPTAFCSGGDVILYASGFSSYVWSTSGTADSIIVNATGSYSVTVTDSMGCQNSTNQNVTVFNLPNVDAGLAAPYCDGDSTQLLAGGGQTYQWTPATGLQDDQISNPYVSTSNSGWYYVTGTDVNNCTDYDSVYVTVNPIPAPPVIAYVQATYLLVSSNYSTGIQWYYNGNPISPGGTDQTYTITPPGGQYWMVHTDVNGCSTINSDTITELFLSTQSIANEIGIQIVPNPNNGLFTIMIENMLFDGAFGELFDITGKLVYTFNMTAENRKTIDISAFENGYYLLRLQMNNTLFTYRIIKQ
jgi:hypothetical protein